MGTAQSNPDQSEGRLRGLWHRFLAYFRLNKKLVCEMSRGMGDTDYHDYPDSIEGGPLHFTRLTCKRCGKRFTI